MKQQFDVLALMIGLAASAVGLAVLANALFGPLDHRWLTIGTPVCLVALGVLGLTLNRSNR